MTKQEQIRLEHTFFDHYQQKYTKVFQNLYPAKNSTGFPERNLSVNFSKAIEESFPSAISWFEYQFGANNNLHYDAVVIIPELKAVYIIESKRFSSPKEKIDEIKSDMIRINAISTAYNKEFADRIKDFAGYSAFGVILADVWTETKKKKAIKESFDNHSFVDVYLSEIATSFTNGRYFVNGFNGQTSHTWLNENYFLVSMIWNVIEHQ